ncbi:putative protocadherin beta-18 isoform X1 [Octopus bimaculoides]|uniref:Cadherin domain-containing protein n=2 Tax=Octopus TaxID=6643 RepID=A0A0L8H748_OCTBM|nr:putative protocadherin beta-18 isoform X1 [Octopus bimaculoides]|eukprot:XP_014774848.1 PREDICTED: putative protocadherin beta-18 isoform X1 [Octopus bimaculoides]
MMTLFGIMLIQVFALLHVLHMAECVDFIYYLKESKSPGTYIGDIGVDTNLMDSISLIDRNLIRFSQLEKDISNNSQLFNVSKRGKLYTAQTLDAESLCKYNTECFKMVDIAVRKKKSFIKILEIKVVVEDVNDHQPEFFSNQVNLQFSEGDKKGTTRSIPNAIDKDIGMKNSKISYFLSKNKDNLFSLALSKRLDNSYSLGITLEKELDREMKDSFMLQVIARDEGSPTKEGILNVNISVSDVNDNSPVFTQNVYNVSVNNQHQIEKPVITVHAMDSDTGKNSKILYHFSSKTSDLVKNHFELDKTTGDIFIKKKMTSRKKLTYKLFIEAQDGGSPPLSSIAMALVNVINQQNNAPTIDVNFSESTGNTATISEDIEVGSFIAYVKVTDNDIGQNGEVTCDLFHEKFQLQNLGKKKYKLTVKNPVDREKKNHIDFTITCKDNGLPSQRTERKFSIQVMDVNDVQPHFTKDTFKFLTYENEKSNFPVGFINASDPDLGLGGQLTFTLLSSDKHVLPFKISNFGFISTTLSLDHEQQKIYKFKVLVKDNGTPSLNNTATVIVEVMDENDNPPYFIFPSVNPSNLDVHYHPKSKNDITVLRASDRDSHVNAFLRFEILGGNEKQLFTVNPHSGILSFSRPVYQNDAGSYELKLVVKDSGTPVLSTTTTLFLTLTVSNTTSKMFTAVDQQSDDMIHINLFIIIVIAAVTVSLVLVVSITVCIVQRHNQRNIRCSSGVDHSSKFVDQSRQTQYFCEQMSSDYDVPVASLARLQNEKTSTLGPREELHSRQDLTHKRTNLAIGVPCQATTEGMHQATKIPGHKKLDEAAVHIPYRYSETSTLSGIDSGSGWGDDGSGRKEELPGLKTCRPGMNQSLDRRTLPQIFSGKKNLSISSQHAHKLDTDTHCNDIINLKSAQALCRNSELAAQSRSLPVKNSFTTYSKPLPAIPKLPYS